MSESTIPGRVSAHDVALQSAEQARATTADARALVDQLAVILEGSTRPARMIPKRLSAQTAWAAQDAVGHQSSPSIGVLNLSPVPVYLGVGGASATKAAGAIPVAPFGALVLPVAVGDVEIATDNVANGLPAAPVNVYLLRFSHVQPFLELGNPGPADANGTPRVASDVTDRAARQLGSAQLRDATGGAELAIDAGTRAARVIDQGGIADSLQASGQAAAPAAGAVIVTIPAPPAGVYGVQAVTMASGDAAQLANVQLMRDAVAVGGLLSSPSPASMTRERLTLNGAQSVSVVAIAAGAAGSVYGAFLALTRLA